MLAPAPSQLAPLPPSPVPHAVAPRVLHIGVLTQYYPPETGAPQARLASLAAAFRDRGHTVSVLTAMPNYPQGSVYPGYGGMLRTEEAEGISIVRSFIAPSQSTRMLPRLTAYGSFAISAAVAGAALLNRLDYLMVESPPLFLGPTAIWLAWRTGARLIVNVSDLWPDAAVRLGIIRRRSMAYRASAALERLCYRKAWLVTAQTEAIVASISRRFPDVRVQHLPNAVDCERFSPTPGAATTPGRDTPCIAAYVGLHGLAQGLDQILDASALLAPGEAISIRFTGDGPERHRLEQRAIAERLSHVQFVGPRAYTDIPAVLAGSDVLLVPLHPDYSDAVPSKLFEAMAAGRPVILLATGRAAELVAQAGAGIVVAPGDIEGFVQALRRLAGDRDLRDRLGANGRRFALDRLDRRQVTAAFAQMLETASVAEGERQ